MKSIKNSLCAALCGALLLSAVPAQAGYFDSVKNWSMPKMSYSTVIQFAMGVSAGMVSSIAGLIAADLAEKVGASEVEQSIACLGTTSILASLFLYYCCKSKKTAVTDIETPKKTASKKTAVTDIETPIVIASSLSEIAALPLNQKYRVSKDISGMFCKMTYQVIAKKHENGTCVTYKNLQSGHQNKFSIE